MAFIQNSYYKYKNQKELEEVVDELKNFGYTYLVCDINNKYPFITTCDEYYYTCSNNNSSYPLANSKEEFLAYCAMTDEKYGIAGEWWKFIHIDNHIDKRFTKNKLYQSNKPLNEMFSFIDDKGRPNGWNFKYFQKATKEEIYNHFNSIPKPYEILCLEKLKEETEKSLEGITIRGLYKIKELQKVEKAYDTLVGFTDEDALEITENRLKDNKTMKKYTKKDVLEQKISFKPVKNKKLFQKLHKHFNLKVGDGITENHYLRFYNCDIYSNCHYKSYLSFFGFYKSTKEISIEEFDFEDEIMDVEFEYTLQDLTDGKVYLENDLELEDLKKVLNYCFSNNEQIVLGLNKFYGKSEIKNIFWKAYPIANTLPIQLGSIFLKELNNKNKMEENKKIIGYKLIKPEYKKVAEEIIESEKGSIDKDLLLKINPFSINLLKKAGVLDLWFEPIYEVKEQIVVMGFYDETFELKIKDKKVYHKNEDITEFVRNLVDKFLNGFKSNVGNYDIKVDCIHYEVYFSKTGCENKRTSLSQWKNVYELIKN